MTSFTHDGVTLILGDCLEHMARMADGAYSLAVVDVPYGIGEDGGKTYQKPSRPNMYGKPPKHTRKSWDTKPGKQYWNTMFRVSKNQIVTGANYFTEFLPPSMGWVFWDKKMGGDYSDGEFIFTSFERAARVFTCHPFDDTRGGKDRIHPTEKPTALYRWLLQNYARPGDTILDTHLGSGSSAIAAWEMRYTFTGIEIDEDYYHAAVERFKKRIAQPYLPGMVQPAKPRQDVLL